MFKEGATFQTPMISKDNRDISFDSEEKKEEKEPLKSVKDSIEQNLQHHPQIAEILFNEYNRLVEDIKKSADEFCQIYNEMFYEKKINKNEVQEAILEQSANLLIEATEQIEGANESDKEAIVKDLVNDFIKQKIAQEQAIEEFKDVILNINKIYQDIWKEENKIHKDDEDKYWEGEDERIKRSTEQIRKEYGDEEAQNYLDEQLTSEQYHAYNSYGMEIEDYPPEKREKVQRQFDEIDKKNAKYDSQRIKGEIGRLESMYMKSPAKFFLGGMQVYWGAIDEKGKSVERIEEDRIKQYQRISEVMKKNNMKNEKKFKPLVDKYKKLLPFQINLERKLEKIIFGHESASMPKELLAELPKQASEIKPEVMPKKMPAYFPVGISKDLPSWQKVQSGEMQAAKPMEMYSYLFWLNNQGKKIQLVVCDEIQTSNYQNLYKLDEAGAREEAKKIGQIEVNNYQNIIDTFGLDNIEIINYQDFKKQSGEEKIEQYKQLCQRLAKEPAWAKAFSSMVQESVGEQAIKEEKEKYLPYAVEELAWIMARDGTKVSHLNEARYDILASVIKNIENYTSQDNKKLEDLNEEEFNQILVGVMQGVNDFINKFKTKEEKGSPRFNYLERSGQLLKQIRRPAKVRPPQGFNKKFICYNFIAPNINAQSFGWRSRGKEKTESVLKFKEPYSTYFYNNDAEMFLNSDQVVAVPNGEISGKIMTLDETKQVQYAREVDMPMLAQYFKTLENAPDDYFKKVGKNKDELMKECQQCETLTDLHRFMQRYIVEPSVKTSQGTGDEKGEFEEAA